MVVRGRPPNDHAIIGFGQGNGRDAPSQSSGRIQEIPLSPWIQKGVTSVRSSLEGESKGQLSARSWRVRTGRGAHQDSPLHWWALTFNGHWRTKWPALPQYKHNPRAKCSCLCCGVSRSRPSCMGSTSAGRWLAASDDEASRWRHGAVGWRVGGGGLDGPPHGARGWSGYPAPRKIHRS